MYQSGSNELGVKTAIGTDGSAYHHQNHKTTHGYKLTPTTTAWWVYAWTSSYAYDYGSKCVVCSTLLSEFIYHRFVYPPTRHHHFQQPLLLPPLPRSLQVHSDRPASRLALTATSANYEESFPWPIRVNYCPWWRVGGRLLGWQIKTEKRSMTFFTATVVLLTFWC